LIKASRGTLYQLLGKRGLNFLFSANSSNTALRFFTSENCVSDRLVNLNTWKLNSMREVKKMKRKRGIRGGK
jgi:hypothetical protein